MTDKRKQKSAMEKVLDLFANGEIETVDERQHENEEGGEQRNKPDRF